MPQCTAKMRIEVPVSLLVFAYMLAGAVTTNWVMYRTCYVVLGFNQSECALLGSRYPDNMTAKLEEKVQPHVTVINMTKTLIEAFATAIVCFFIGPWSDKYGRKPVLLLSFGGTAVAYVIMAVISEIPDISPWYTLLSAVPLCFSGGTMTVLTAVLCYINDLTPPEKRGVRIAIFYATVSGGFLLGSLTSSYALYVFGYFVLYLIATSCVIAAWFIVYLFLPESVSNPETENKFRNLFKLSLLQETVQTAFKSRENHHRVLLLILTFFLIVFVLANNADSMMFLYVRQKFHWSLQKYTIYSCFSIVVEVLGGVVGIYCLHKLLGFKEPVVISIGLISLLFGYLLRGLASESWHIYAAGVVKCFGATISPMARSLVSKIVPADEYGKVFSFIAIGESVISPLGSPMYTYIYNNTLATFPGAFNLVSAGIYAVEMIFAIVIIVMRKRQDRIPYENFDTETSVN